MPRFPVKLCYTPADPASDEYDRTEIVDIEAESQGEALEIAAERYGYDSGIEAFAIGGF